MQFLRLSMAAALLSGVVSAQTAPTLAGCPNFPANSIYNTPIDTLPVHPYSANYINSIATTTGLRAMDGASSGTTFGPVLRTRPSQSEESGIHTSGTRVLPLAWPTPFRVAPVCPATAAATSAGSADVTSTAMHLPFTCGLASVHAVASCCTTGAISGAAATLRCNVLSQPGEATTW